MHLAFHPEAREDLKRAAQHYAEVSPALGQRYYQHLEGLLQQIAAKPDLYRIFRPPSARRHFHRPFPYAVVYVIKPDVVWVLAVMHFKQPPTYWLHRLSN